MNINKHSNAVIASATVAILAALTTAANADTNAAGRKLTISAYLDAPGADLLMQGDYATAVKKIQSGARSGENAELVYDTNLCVAYTMSQQWEAAQSKCDAAVTDARIRGPDDVFDFGASHNARLGAAYSNRAVLHWLQGKPQKALADMAKAHSIAPKTTFVTDNWVALNNSHENTSGPAVAAIQR